MVIFKIAKKTGAGRADTYRGDAGDLILSPKSEETPDLWDFGTIMHLKPQIAQKVLIVKAQKIYEDGGWKSWYL